jgi:hypothetical protein
MYLSFSANFRITEWVSTLRTRLRVCRAAWRCCSSLQGRPCGLVAPSQAARQTHTRARPTAGSRLNRILTVFRVPTQEHDADRLSPC